MLHTYEGRPGWEERGGGEGGGGEELLAIQGTEPQGANFKP